MVWQKVSRQGIWKGMMRRIGGGTRKVCGQRSSSVCIYITQILLTIHSPQPDNILLTAGYGDLKIGGFGNARYIETGNQLTDLTYCGVEFLAPEVVTLQPLTTGADIWSTGVLACYM